MLSPWFPFQGLSVVLKFKVEESFHRKFYFLFGCAKKKKKSEDNDVNFSGEWKEIKSKLFGELRNRRCPG